MLDIPTMYNSNFQFDMVEWKFNEILSFTYVYPSEPPPQIPYTKAIFQLPLNACVGPYQSF